MAARSHPSRSSISTRCARRSANASSRLKAFGMRRIRKALFTDRSRHMPNALQQVAEALVCAQAVEFRINFQPQSQPAAAIFVGFFEPGQRLFLFPKSGVDRS